MSVEFRTDFLEKLKKVNKGAFLTGVMGKVGVLAVNFSKERFVDKNWLDRDRKAWQPRKRPARGSILVKSGRLKRSIRKLAQGNYYVYIGTDVPYAKIHNEGGQINKTVNVKAHTRKKKSGRGRTGRGGRGESSTMEIKAHRRRTNINMPRRRFMGDSAILSRRIERLLSREIDNEINRS